MEKDQRRCIHTHPAQPTTHLRFVEREITVGRVRILQQKWETRELVEDPGVASGHAHRCSHEWRDVPLVDLDKPADEKATKA